jgi:hypothetical protein
MKKLIFVLFLIYCSGFAQSQTKITVSFLPFMGNAPLLLNKPMILSNDTIAIATFKFYISNIYLLEDIRIVDTLSPKYFLIDLEDSNSTKLQLMRNNLAFFNAISFCVGIDSTTNVNGAMGGALDPTNGMYWAWQSGYINLKLEGRTTYNSQKLQQIEMHIGGYLNPYNALQKIIFKNVSSNKFDIQVDVGQLIFWMKTNKIYKIMSPSKQAQNFSRTIASIFYMKG